MTTHNFGFVLTALGIAAVILGGLAFVVSASGHPTQLVELATLYGGICGGGLVLVTVGLIVQALADTAMHTRQLVEILRDREGSE